MTVLQRLVGFDHGWDADDGGATVVWDADLAWDADSGWDLWEEGLGWDADAVWAPPRCSPSTLHLYDWLGPGMRAGDQLTGWALLAVCSALGEPMWEVEHAVRGIDGRPGWAAVFDPDTVPAAGIPWYEMTVGLFADPALPEPQRRERLVVNPAFSRGGGDSIADAVRLALTGDRRVAVYERTDPDDYGADQPWRILVDTYAAETPDPAAAEARARAAKPAPDLLAYRTLAGATYDQLAAEFDTVDDFEGRFAAGTVADVRVHLPASEVL